MSTKTNYAEEVFLKYVMKYLIYSYSKAEQWYHHHG